MSKKNIIIILRGHIRNSFDNDKLYNLIKKISLNYNISIYIHTWNIQQSNISWREVEQINNIIKTDMIHNYFKDLSFTIKNIIIDDDTEIELIGNTIGTIGPKCPIIGWKRYIYCLYKIIDHVKNYSTEEFILNIRFDILSNSIEMTETQIINFVNKNINNQFKKNRFIYDNLNYGLDNAFCGNSFTIYKLCKYFNEDLDAIISKYKYIQNQEYLLFIENELIF
jgi:hypothetical protein